MIRTRIIPCLQLIGESLVKTVKFGQHGYIGDPINTVRIFNELEVDELCFLDIRAAIENREPNLSILRQIADECFMPLSYGGGVRDFNTAKNILSIGFEKIVLNSITHSYSQLVKELSEHFGSQAVIASIDIKRGLLGRYSVYTQDGRIKTDKDPVEWAQTLERLGAGEILLTSMDREGTWTGYDIEITRKISDAVSIPVIANGGAGCVEDIVKVVKEGHAAAASVGSMVVYQKKDMGVLVNFPDKQKLDGLLGQ